MLHGIFRIRKSKIFHANEINGAWRGLSSTKNKSQQEATNEKGVAIIYWSDVFIMLFYWVS